MDVLLQQLKKGSLEIVVLQCLSEADRYGYELLTMIDERSGGYYSLKEGSLYPVLYRLEEKRYVDHYQKVYSEERRVPRKYYRLTVEGMEALTRMKNAWEIHKNATDRILRVE